MMKPPSKRQPRARDRSELRIRWTGARKLYDFWGQEIRRYYSLDTLENAVTWYLNTGDKFIAASAKKVLGPAPIASYVFELFQEGRHQLIYRLRVVNASDKAATFAFVVAKNHEEHSRIAEREHVNLRIIHERAPEHVVRPFLGGRIHLPLGHGKTGARREVYAYLTQWLGNYHELGVHRDLQFFINTLHPQRFTHSQTEQLKTLVVEIVARTYDAGKLECIEMPQVASGDFVVTKPNQGALKLKLIACRKLTFRVTPPRLIHAMLSAHWDWGGRDFHLAPAEPAAFAEGLSRAVGRDTARSWLLDYKRQVELKTIPELGRYSKRAIEMMLRG